jgi:hypothetical protein
LLEMVPQAEWKLEGTALYGRVHPEQAGGLVAAATGARLRRRQRRRALAGAWASMGGAHRRQEMGDLMTAVLVAKNYTCPKAGIDTALI